MGLANLIKRELWLSIFIGSIPASLVVYFNGVEAFLDFVKSMAPSSEISIYFGFLFLVQIVLFIRIAYFQKDSIEHRDELFELYTFWGQLGFTLLGIYRAILGVCFVVLGVSFFEVDFEFLPLILTKGGFAIFVFFSGSILFSWLQLKTTLKKSTFS